MATANSDWGLPTWKLLFNAGTQKHGATFPFLHVTNTSRTFPFFVVIRRNIEILTRSTEINNVTLGYIMKDFWLSFATDLDPNARSFSNTGKPFWPQYTADTDNNVTFAIMDVNYTMMGVTEDFDASPQCDFFHGQSYAVRN